MTEAHRRRERVGYHIRHFLKYWALLCRLYIDFSLQSPHWTLIDPQLCFSQEMWGLTPPVASHGAFDMSNILYSSTVSHIKLMCTLQIMYAELEFKTLPLLQRC